MTMSFNASMNESDDERDLTSLTWLMELRNQNFSWSNVMPTAPLDDDTNHSRSIEAATEVDPQHKELFARANRAKTKNDINTNAVPNSTQNLDAIANEAGLYNGKSRRNVDPVEDIMTLPTDVVDAKKTKRPWNGKCLNKSCNKTTDSALPIQQSKLQLKRTTPTERYEMFMEKVKRDFEEYQKSAMNYQTDTMEKPPFNYSHIIGMAMLENGRVTLQQICTWIEKKFAFFRVRKKWNNSIRHNLSLHQCFRKIDRKKFEKGKGGYWELGIDPRKSDRKRIRNRKGTQHRSRHQHLQQQQQKQQQKEMFSTNKIDAMPTTTTYNSRFENYQYQLNQQNSSLEFENLTQLQIKNCFGDCSPQNTNEIQPICKGSIANTPQDECTANHANEHLLLDELEIQQNIDVISCCQQPQQDQHIFIGGILQCNAPDVTTTTLNNVSSDNSQQTIELLQKHQQQQYHLGTIIIRTTATNTGDISDFAATTGSINCFINEECVNEKQPELHQQNFLYSNEDEIPASCKHIFVSSYLDNDNEVHDISKNTNCQINAQSRRIMNCHPDLATNTMSPFALTNSNPALATLTTKGVSPVLLDSDENDKKDISSSSQRPNVIVEQLMQPSGYAIAAPLATTTATALMTHATDIGLNTPQHDQQIMAIDSMRPYIDGIEEAFQYLRSMDNNREDLLDNFLDISVSDY